MNHDDKAIGPNTNHTMSSTTTAQKTGKGRKKITRTACEPCREKRSKCNGQQPCERCTNRNLECHFTQRAWSSKRSLLDDITSLKARLEKREDLLEALLVPGTGDSLLSMLRSGEVSVEQAGDKIASARKVINKEHQQNDSRRGRLGRPGGMDDGEMAGWSPITGTLRSPGAHTTLSDDSYSQGFPASVDGSASGIMAPPWATPNLDTGLPPPTNSRQQSFSNMLEGDAMDMNTDTDTISPQQQQQPPPNSMPPGGNMSFMAAGAALDAQVQLTSAGNRPPTVIDPLLWPPPNASDPLGVPSANSWTGLQGLLPGEVGVPV